MGHLCPAPALVPDPKANMGPTQRCPEEGYGHKEAPEEEHEDKISRAAPEGALLQHAAVAEPAAAAV